MKKQGTIAFMCEPGKVEYRTYELPKPEKGALLMKLKRCNVCGSELHIWKGSMPRTTFGHEGVGTVAELGEGVTTDSAGRPLAIGDRIVSTYFSACGKCVHCNRGEFYKCDNAYAHKWKPDTEEWPHFFGMFATHYYIWPDYKFYKVPENVPDSVAGVCNCAVPQVLFGYDKADLRMGDWVLIQGAGGLGLFAAAAAKVAGAKVIVVDGVPARLEQAKKFGADYIIDMNEYDTPEKRHMRAKELVNGEGVDMAVELTGVPAAFKEGFGYIRSCGKYLSMGNVTLGTTVDIDPAALTKQQAVIIPVNRYQPWYIDKALHFISDTIDRFPYEDMIDADYPFDRLADAMNDSVARKVTRASIVIDG